MPGLRLCPDSRGCVALLQLMKEPPIEKRNVLKTLRVLAEKAHHRSTTIRQLAARALGNAAGSMPVEVRRISLRSDCRDIPLPSKTPGESCFKGLDRAAKAKAGLLPKAALLSLMPAGLPRENWVPNVRGTVLWNRAVSHVNKEQPLEAGRALSLCTSLALQVRKHGRQVVQVLQQSLADTACPEVVAESMLALAELVRVLQAVNLGSAFEDIARSTKMFFESVSEPSSSCRCSEKRGVGRGLHAPPGWPLLAECLLRPRYPADKRLSGCSKKSTFATRPCASIQSWPPQPRASGRSLPEKWRKHGSAFSCTSGIPTSQLPA